MKEVIETTENFMFSNKTFYFITRNSFCIVKVFTQNR